MDSDFQTVILNGRFNGDISAVTVGPAECKIKSASNSAIKCRVENLPAGTYLPTVLSAQGFSVLPDDEEDYLVFLYGTIHYNYPKGQ